MKLLFLSLLILPKLYSQTAYDKTQDLVIAKLNETTQTQAAHIKSLIGDSIYQARQINDLTNQGIKLQKEVTALTLRMNDVNNRLTNTENGVTKVQKEVTALVLRVNDINNRLTATENQVTKDGKNIYSLTLRVNALSKTSDSLVNQIRLLKLQNEVVNSLEAVPPLKMARVGTTLTYRISMDSATNKKDGYMTKFRVNQLESQVRFNQSLHGNTQAITPAITVPDKAKVIIINLKE